MKSSSRNARDMEIGFDNVGTRGSRNASSSSAEEEGYKPEPELARAPVAQII